MGGLMSTPSPEAAQRTSMQSRRELESYIREQAQGQEKLTKIIVARSEKLEDLKKKQQELTKGSREELEIKEKIARVEENNFRLRENYKQRDSVLNQALDAKERASGRGVPDVARGRGGRGGDSSGPRMPAFGGFGGAGAAAMAGLALPGAIGAMAALSQRDVTGLGQEVQSSLFENNVFLVGQHMMQYAVTGNAAKPMPSRISAWAIYDVFEVANGEKLFLAVVSDTQWKIFCDAFGFADLFADPSLKLNNQRVEARSTLIPEVRSRLAGFTAKHISEVFEKNGLPFAPITKPEQLFNDPHLIATGGLATIKITDGPKAGVETTTPLLPLMMDGERLGIRHNPPKEGEQTQEILLGLGYGQQEISKLIADGAVHQ
jgi:hypothetical protein